MNWEEYSIPIVFNSDNIQKEVEQLLSRYIKSIKEEYADSIIIEKLEQFKKYCGLVYSNYFRGWHSSAFENFKKAINALDVNKNKYFIGQMPNDVIYKGRINSGYKMYKFEDMVHIPIDKRYLVQTQRYSFPGLPCFYAGASAYSCWNELNKPSIEEFQVASFKPVGRFKKEIFDLSILPNMIKEYDMSYILYWPLLALCSIKVNHEDAAFKPEYIFPQYLLEYIQRRTNQKIVGIKYASIKVLELSNLQAQEDWHTYVNYVFPTQSESCEGNIDENISNYFKRIKNRSGKEIQIIRDHIIAKSTIVHWDTFDNVEIIDDIERKIGKYNLYLEGGEKIPYADTVFGIIEKSLNMDYTIGQKE